MVDHACAGRATAAACAPTMATSSTARACAKVQDACEAFLLLSFKRVPDVRHCVQCLQCLVHIFDGARELEVPVDDVARLVCAQLIEEALTLHVSVTSWAVRLLGCLLVGGKGMIMTCTCVMQKSQSRYTRCAQEARS